MIALLDKLNPQQREAVETLDGPVLVVAGAGSGKTRVITTRIMHLYQKGVSPYQILAMTFTNKAAFEMRSRVAQGLQESMRDLTVTTFHSFCARFLRREIRYLDREPNFAIFDAHDQTTCLRRVIRDMGYPEKEVPAALYRARFSFLKNQGDPDAVPERELDRKLFLAYQDALKEQNALDFDDLLTFTVRILGDFIGCRERYQGRYQYIMVDEYQDTNVIQAKLVGLLLNEDRNLCVVGDEDQSIYGWRGADIRNILDFEDHYPDARIFKLEQNYRSTQNILDYANRVIGENLLRKPKKLWTSAGPGAAIRIMDQWTSQGEAESIIQTVQGFYKRENLAYNNFAILFRANFLSRNLEDMCRRYRIPYQLIGGLKFYDRKEIKDLLAYMRIVVNPRDWTSFTRAIGVPTRGIGPKSLDKLFRLINEGYNIPEMLERAIETRLLTGKGLAGLKAFAQLYAYLAEVQNECTPREWAERLIEALDYRSYLEKTDEATVEYRVENLNELLESMKEMEEEQITTLAQFMDFSSLVNDQDEFDENEPKICLMTVHAAKGLEFDTVFVMGLEDGIFPNQRALTENPNGLEEERRLFYVAVTRARKRLYLSYARRRQIYGTTSNNPKSRFLVAPGKGVEDSDVFPGRKRPKKVKLADLGAQIEKMKVQLKKQDVDVDFDKVVKQVRFLSGDTVRHPKFGIGTVTAVRGRGDQQTVSVYFPGRGKKTLVARMAHLEKI